MDRNTPFDKTDFYKVVSMCQSLVIFGLLAIESMYQTPNFFETPQYDIANYR
jgi:hypothetical protein